MDMISVSPEPERFMNKPEQSWLTVY